MQGAARQVGDFYPKILLCEPFVDTHTLGFGVLLKDTSVLFL